MMIQGKHTMKTLAAVGGVAVMAAGCLTARLEAGNEAVPRGDRTETVQAGVVYQHFGRENPRPLRIHVLRIDLSHPGLALAVTAAPDPDGDGPAETVLTPPLDLARQGGFAAAVNTAPWVMLPDPETGEKIGYIAGGACDIAGWAVMDGRQLSPPQHYCSFWLDRDGAPHLADVKTPPEGARLAVTGFGRLLREGTVLPGESDVRHPRTALGLSEDRRFLILAVVDGRQPGYSEGMSERELAELMAELRCHDATNLDGGGSSVMVLCNKDKQPRIVNSPSDRAGPRPIPLMLGVQQVEKHGRSK